MGQIKSAPGSLGSGERIYAIGDIHGCVGRIEAIHRLIGRDIERRPATSTTIVYLGDYIDRGPDSAGVLDAVIAPQPDLLVDRRIFLMGNHEAMFLEAFHGNDVAFSDWYRNGGDVCLESWHASKENWRQKIPLRHRSFLTNLSLTYAQGDYLFVHAGLRPGLKLKDQDADDLVWIRSPFLESNYTFPHVIIHGHSPESFSPTVRRNRIGIDTGAVYGGPLTCIVLEGKFMSFFRSRSSSGKNRNTKS